MSRDRRLRICMVTTFYPPYHFGGDAIQVYRLSEALAAAGHAVEVVHSIDAYHLHHPAPPETEFEHHPRIRRHSLRSSHPRLATLVSHQTGGPGVHAEELATLLSRGAYDVIHFHNVSLAGGPAVLELGTAIKLYTAHEYWLICPTHVLFRFNREACSKRTCLPCTLRARRPPQLWRYTGLRRRALAQLDRLLLPSRFSLDTHREAGIDVPMEILPHFVPEETAPDDDAPPAGRPPAERPYFLYAGRLEKLKGVDELLDLFTRFPAADLLIAGEGERSRDLRRRAESLTNVSFLGALHPAELKRYYRHAVAVLAPSLCFESFGLTPIEAFQQGCPAIVRNHGALPELIDQGAGFTFSTLDECAEAMRTLLETDGLRDTLGERARRAVNRNWSARVHLERYLALIETARLERLGKEAMA